MLIYTTTTKRYVNQRHDTVDVVTDSLYYCISTDVLKHQILSYVFIVAVLLVSVVCGFCLCGCHLLYHMCAVSACRKPWCNPAVCCLWRSKHPKEFKNRTFKRGGHATICQYSAKSRPAVRHAGHPRRIFCVGLAGCIPSSHCKHHRS